VTLFGRSGLLFPKRHLKLFLLGLQPADLLLCLADPVAHRVEPADHVVDPRLLQLQPRREQLHARPGAGHLLHRRAQAPDLGQQRGKDVVPRRHRRLPGHGDRRRQDHRRRHATPEDLQLHDSPRDRSVAVF
jgi:hypothetical protein